MALKTRNVQTAASANTVPALGEAHPIHPSPSERLVTISSALSDPTRVEMLQLILEQGEVACSDFDRRLPLSQPTISYHTKILNAAGLIGTRREGRFFSYRSREHFTRDE